MGRKGQTPIPAPFNALGPNGAIEHWDLGPNEGAAARKGRVCISQAARSPEPGDGHARGARGKVNCEWPGGHRTCCTSVAPNLRHRRTPEWKDVDRRGRSTGYHMTWHRGLWNRSLPLESAITSSTRTMVTLEGVSVANFLIPRFWINYLDMTGFPNLGPADTSSKISLPRGCRELRKWPWAEILCKITLGTQKSRSETHPVSGWIDIAEFIFF
jgi:hypothetical protein